MNEIKVELALEDEIPQDIKYAAADASIERHKEILAIDKELSTTLSLLKNESQEKILSIIGPETEKYLEYHGKMKERIIDMQPVFTPTPEGDKIEKEFKRNSVAEARQFVESLKIDVNEIKSIQKEYIAKVQEAVDKAMKVQEAPYVELRSTELPKAAFSNPRTYKYPPYDGHWGYWQYYRTRGSSLVSQYENWMTGEISCHSDIRLHGADDSDTSYTNALSEILVWYQLPRDGWGQINAWIDLQCIDSNVNGCLDNEWGYSDASIQQLERIYMEVLSPAGTRRYGTLLDYRRGENDGCWSKSAFTPNCFRRVHLISPERYDSNQWVWIAIGIHDYNNVWVNDMSCDSKMRNKYFVKQIVLQPTIGNKQS